MHLWELWRKMENAVGHKFNVSHCGYEAVGEGVGNPWTGCIKRNSWLEEWCAKHADQDTFEITYPALRAMFLEW